MLAIATHKDITLQIREARELEREEINGKQVYNAPKPCLAWEPECRDSSKQRPIRFPYTWEGCVNPARKEISWEEMRLGSAEWLLSGQNASHKAADGGDEGLEEYRLWREIKKQVELLREGLEDAAKGVEE